MTAGCLDITGRVAVVVGGTSGLGRTIALGLATAGADVVATGRRKALVDAVAQEIVDAGRRTIAVAADVHRRDSLDALQAAVLAAFGGVDILVNAAGRTLKKSSLSLTDVDWATVMETNLTGTLRSCQAFYEPLKASGRGRIVNIASLASFVAFHQVAAYSASKAALLSLTQSLGTEWAKDEIRVNAIVPGVFVTDLNRAFLDGSERGREMLARTPLNRFGRPEELIGAAVFLASDAVSFMTGQAIVIDGGYLASGVNC